MIRFQAFGTDFRLPLLNLFVPFLASRLGLKGSMGAIFLALCGHELAHLLAARQFGVRIAEIQLAPFGGSAKIENPYQLPGGKIIPVAAAGAAANLLMAMLWAFLAHWNLVSFACARRYIQPNLLLMFFNLLPALPLDGGRILFALLERPLGEKRALSVCLFMSGALAAGLLGCAMLGAVRSGIWNLTLIFAGLMIFASARDERAALQKTKAERLEAQLHSPPSPQRIRLFQLDEDTPLHAALNLLRTREGTWFVLLRHGRPTRILDGRTIVRQTLGGTSPDTALKKLSPAVPVQGLQPVGRANLDP